MENSEFIVFLLSGSLISPLLTAVVNQPGWSRNTRLLMSILISVIVAVVTILGTGGFTGDWYADFLLVMTVSTFAYETLWKPSGVAPTIERATSASAPPGQ